MKIEIEIPDDELRTCVSCSYGEMNLTLNVNETIDGYDITDIVSDTYVGNASLNFRILENVGDLRERLIKREMNKTYKVFCIGGDPKKIAFLANALREKIDDLQSSGWEIDCVDLINNTRAWDSGKQMYVETPEYIIRAKKEE